MTTWVMWVVDVAGLVWLLTWPSEEARGAGPAGAGRPDWVGSAAGSSMHCRVGPVIAMREAMCRATPRGYPLLPVIPVSRLAACA